MSAASASTPTTTPPWPPPSNRRDPFTRVRSFHSQFTSPAGGFPSGFVFFNLDLLQGAGKRDLRDQSSASRSPRLNLLTGVYIESRAFSGTLNFFWRKNHHDRSWTTSSRLRTGEPLGWNQVHPESVQRSEKRHVGVLSAGLDTDLKQRSAWTRSVKKRVQGLRHPSFGCQRRQPIFP